MRNRLLNAFIASALLSSTALAETYPPNQAPPAPISRAHALNDAMLNQTVKVIAPGGVGSGTVFQVVAGGRRVNAVLTNAHVVAGFAQACADLAMKEDEIGCQSGLPSIEIRAWVTKNDKVYPISYKGRLIMQSIRPQQDLALILIDKNWPGGAAEPLPDDESLEQSDIVYVAGCPLGERPQITTGMVSLLDDDRNNGPSLEVSAPIFPGNSGGGLYVERNGKFYFVGIPSAVANIHGTAAFSHGFVVPLDTIKAYLASLNLNF